VKVVLAAIVWPLTALYFAWCAGLVFSKLWLWYVVPHGHGALTWQQCGIGYLALRLAKLKRPSAEPPDTRTTEEILLEALAAFCFPWIVLLLGWWLK